MTHGSKPRSVAERVLDTNYFRKPEKLVADAQMIHGQILGIQNSREAKNPEKLDLLLRAAVKIDELISRGSLKVQSEQASRTYEFGISSGYNPDSTWDNIIYHAKWLF